MRITVIYCIASFSPGLVRISFSVFRLYVIVMKRQRSIKYRRIAMITGTIKNKVDKIWLDVFAGGMTNPLTVIEQLT